MSSKGGGVLSMTTTRRRAKGTGSVRERSKGRWEVRYDGPPDAAGTGPKVYESVHGSRRDAERVLRQRLGVVEDGNYVPGSKDTVAEFMARWFVTYASTNTAPSTQRGYEGCIRRYIAPALGSVALQKLRPHDIQGLYEAMLEKGLSAQTVILTHRVLRQTMNHAVKWGSLTRNPADATTPPRREKRELKMWPVETLNRFLGISKETQYGDLYHLAVLTGLRRSELLGLQWASVDLESASLRVVRALHRINGVGLVIGQPKTTKSRRSIALSPVTVKLMERIRRVQIENKLAAGPAWNDGDFVFAQANGRPLHPDKVSNTFRSIVVDAGLPHLTLHGLRHAHATLMLLAGVHPKIVSERLGHAYIAITLDIYSHVIEGMQEEAVEALDPVLAAGGQS
jgi:integrase